MDGNLLRYINLSNFLFYFFNVLIREVLMQQTFNFYLIIFVKKKHSYVPLATFIFIR